MSTPPTFGELSELIEDIPPEGLTQMDIDHPYAIRNRALYRILTPMVLKKDTLSFRDLLRHLNQNLMVVIEAEEGRPKKLISEQIFTNLNNVSSLATYLFFDFCLAILDNDVTDAMLYLANAENILVLLKSFSRVLSTINDHKSLLYKSDSDARGFLALIARSIEPLSAHTYRGSFGDAYERRYVTYRGELKKYGFDESSL